MICSEAGCGSSLLRAAGLCAAHYERRRRRRLAAARRAAGTDLRTVDQLGPDRYTPGRVCMAEGCATVLSIYNPGPVCHVHAAVSLAESGSIGWALQR